MRLEHEIEVFMFSVSSSGDRQGKAPSVVTGEMKARISSFNWSDTQLGALKSWPESLKHAVELTLQSPIPTLLSCGSSGVLLYNDAYAALADFYHPDVLGQSFQEAWPEMGDYHRRIQSIVLSGRTLSFRNKRLKLPCRDAEQSFWFDLHYSPVVSETGSSPIAVVLTVHETTNDVVARLALRAEVDRLTRMFEHAPGLMAMSRGPDHVFELANRAYMELVGQREILGKPVREALPELLNQRFPELLDEVYKSAKPYIGTAVPILLIRSAGKEPEERFVNFIYQPICESDGSVIGIFLEGQDVTKQEEVKRELERQRRLLYIGERSALVGGWEYDIQAGTLFWTDQIYRILELDPGSEPSLDLFKAHLDSQSLLAFERAVEDALRGTEMNIELSVLSSSQRKLCVHLKGLVSSEDGEFRTIYGSMQDITRSRDAALELELRNQSLESAHDGIVITDPDLPDNPIIYCNTGFTRLTGFPKEEIIGLNCRFLQGEETDHSVVRDLATKIAQGESWQGTLKNYRKDGSAFWNRLSISPVYSSDGVLRNFIGIQTDASEGVELNDVIQHQATHDALTDLVNRQTLEQRLDALIRTPQRGDMNCVLLYLNLDNFRIINEISNHATGDLMLLRASEAITSHARDGDIVARLGGDTFGMLLQDSDLDEAQHIAALLIAALYDIRLPWEDKMLRVSASVGLVPVSDDLPSTTVIIKAADSACAVAKREGGNRIHVYHLHDLTAQRRQTDIEMYACIIRGLDDGHFYLVQQVIEPSAASDTAGPHFELLLRLQDPVRGLISPGEFIPAAERLRLAPRIDKWVIENAFDKLSRQAWKSQAYLCSINLSGVSINQSDFADFILEKLTQYDVQPNRICFEVTETAVIESLGSATDFIRRVREAGCLLALDDFGSGLSSYGYLRSLDVDFVKIDGSFVRNMHLDEVDFAIVKSIHDLTSLMGKQTIAEFVENQIIRGKLTDLGVDFVQGYGVGKPKPFD